MNETLTKLEREALKACYRRTREPRAARPGRDGGGGARTGDVAEDLGVSPASVTSAFKRLAERGLVDHTPYRGVELTASGRRVALATIRRHRIVERFLADMLGYPWNDADRLAASFEHELPQEVEDRLFVALHRPTTCPHGFPIPEPELGEMPSVPPLYELEPGDRAVIAVPGSTDPDVVAFLETLGLRPGVEVEVREKHPFDGPIVLRVGEHDRTLGERVARQIYVSRDPTHQLSGGAPGATTETTT